MLEARYLYRIWRAGWQLKFTRGTPDSMQMMLLGFQKEWWQGPKTISGCKLAAGQERP